MVQEAENIERPDDLVIVASNIYALRKAHVPKLSQEKLAQRADLSAETVAKLEMAREPGREANYPRLDTLVAIARALGVEVADLLRWDAEATRVYLQRFPTALDLIHGAGRGKVSGQVPLMQIARAVSP